MPILQYETRVSPEGYVTPLPPEFYGRKVVVLVNEEQDRLAEKSPIRGKRKAIEQSKLMNRTPEERQAAFEDFMTSWKGCLKGVPHMTAKEIRAERLEKKYGEHRRGE